MTRIPSRRNIFINARQVGKTHLLRKYAKEWIQSNERAMLILRETFNSMRKEF